MKLDLRVGVFLALLSAAYVACEICSKLDSCEDARIRAFLTEKGQTVTKFQAQQLHTTEVKQSNGQVLPAASKNLFQLDITKSTTSQVAECTEELKIDLSSERSIAGFYIQTCIANATLHQQFLHETREWQPVKCAHAQDSVLSSGLFRTKMRVSVFLSAPCTNEVIHFRYFVRDALNHLHGPYTKEYPSYESSSVIADDSFPKYDAQGKHDRERVKRATTGYLVIGNRLYVHQLSLDGTRAQAIISGQTFASIVDFHFQQGHLYWTDRSENRIMRSNLDGSMKTALLDQGIGLPEGLAVDWISDKLYWADFTNRQIRVLDLNTGLHKELISTGSNSNLRGIAVDPIQRMIFWTDWYSSSPKIERASMDGTNRTILHSTELTLPFAITLDYDSQVIYWADQSHDRIETSNYDGSNRTVLISTGLDRPFDITVFGDMLYWSDFNIGIRTANKSGSQAVSTLYDRSEFCDNVLPFGIQVVAEHRQPQALNPCGSNNGGCSDFCLLSSFQSLNYSCACPDGMVLQSDMRTCAFASPGVTQETPMASIQGSCSTDGYQTNCCDPTMSTCRGSSGTCYCDAKCHLLGDCCGDVPQNCSTLQDVGPYIVFSNKRYIHLLSLDGARTRTVRSSLSNAVGIDYHYRMNYMFWTDINTDQLWKSRLDGTDARLLLGTGLRTPEDIAIDWISDKIYWTDNALDAISVMSIEGGFYKIVVDTGANTIPRSIVVDPINRQMYWTDRGSVPKIEGASMDGTNRRVIHSTNLIFPDGITLDQSAQTLYWIDFQRDVIESSHVDGTARMTVTSSNILQPFGLTQYGGIIYYTDWLIGISSANITTRQSNTLFDNICENAYGIEVVSEDRQPTAPNPCEINNGGCTHLCLLSSTNSSGYSCTCADGFYLDTDQRTCINPDDTGTPTTQVPPPGTCAAANYTTCCRSGTCRGYPPNCFCNAQCVSFRDCCVDFHQICDPNSDEISISGNVTVNLTQPVISQFQCMVVASSVPNIQWTFTSDITQEEQHLTDTTGSLDVKHSIVIPPSDERSSILTVSNVLFTDAGMYKCFAEINGIRLESSARLTVLVPPAMPLLTVNSNAIRESEVLQLVCKVRAYPVASISWVKTTSRKGTAILNGGRTQIIVANFIENGDPFTTSTLTIVNVGVTDGGNYLCEANNGLEGYSAVSAVTVVDVIATNECLTNNQLCQNGGTCVDYPSGYGCNCADSFFGSNCQQESPTGGPDIPIIIDPPTNNLNTTLATAVNLTCTAEGHPAPRYEWYRDDELLPGESRFYLYIPEALPGHRGNYTCKATNNLGETESEPVRLDIQGIFQYVASVELSQSTANQSGVIQEVLSIVGLNNNDTKVYSIEVLNSTTSEGTMFLITLLTNSSSPVTIRTFVYNELERSGTVASVISLIRHDGCTAEFDDTINYVWSEATIGDKVYGSCPCSEFLPVGLNEANVIIRYCQGTNRDGGMWAVADYSQCATVVNELSQGLCNDLLNLMMSPVNISESIVRRTSQSQKLTAVDVAIATEAVVRLTEQAIVNPEIRDNYLSIIDNIQMADAKTVSESRSSSRLLESLGQFLDEVQISNNAIDNLTILTYQTYALQLQDIDPERFNGQTLNIDLGSVEEAMNLGGEIDDDALRTSETAMNVLTNATGTIQTSESLFSYCSQRTMSSVNGPQLLQRLSYSVFLSDVLFQTVNQSLKIGSLILAARFSCGSNATLMPPITVTLRTNTEFEKNASNSTCAMWNSDRFGTWSGDGCKEVVRGNNRRVCECTQLAHFGILFDLNPQPLPPDAALTLSIVTYIGSVLSLLCLIAFIVTYLAVKKLRTSVHGKILVNMSLALMGLYISFLIGGSRHVTSIKILCGFTAAFLNYFVLVFFAWTSAEAVWLYLKLVKVIGISQYESKFIPISMPTLWFVPLLIVAISAGAGHRYYTGPFYCRATEWPFWFALVLPFLLMYMFDWIMFFLIMGSICKSRNIIHAQSTSEKNSISPKILKQNLLIAVVLSTTFGLGWGFGQLATSHDVVAITIVFQVLFSIFVGAQGVLIFFFHGVHNTDARSFWKNCFVTLSKQPRRVYNIAHSTSQERNLTASPLTDSYGFSSDSANNTGEYETMSSATTSTVIVDTKANVAYGHFETTATEGVYDTPGSVTITNQAYGTSRLTAANGYDEIVSGDNVYETIPI